MSIGCRNHMEIEAREEVVRFLAKQPLESFVPEEENTLQRQVLR